MTLPLLLALPLALTAPPVHLDDALRAALATDPTLAAAGVRTRAREAAVVSARGAFDLVLELQLDADTERQTGAFPGSAPEALNTTNLAIEAAVVQPLVWGTQLRLGLGHTLTATDNPFRNCIPGQASDQCHQARLELVVQQPLLRGFGRGVNEAGVRAARATVDAGKARRVAAAEQVLESVVVAYVELAFAQEDLAIRQGAVQLAERQLEATEARIDAGRAAPVDLAVVRQTLAERRRAEHAAARLAEDRAASLAVLMGVEAPPEAARLPEPAPWVGDAAAAAEAAAAGPELQAAAKDIEARAEALAQEADATRPQLDLRLVAARSASTRRRRTPSPRCRTTRRTTTGRRWCSPGRPATRPPRARRARPSSRSRRRASTSPPARARRGARQPRRCGPPAPPTARPSWRATRWPRPRPRTRPSSRSTRWAGRRTWRCCRCSRAWPRRGWRWRAPAPIGWSPRRACGASRAICWPTTA
ncbi:MAG: TolC family protein [Myxococcales bacterium]|nr:TolC family protein [Myxococcales bacterium]